MSDKLDLINNLSIKLEDLLKKHEDFSIQINNISAEIAKLKNVEILLNRPIQTPEDADTTKEFVEIKTVIAREIITPNQDTEVIGQQESSINNESNNGSDKREVLSTKNNAFEKYVGENLISKIGIIITVIGVAIGAKYSIDNDLISPTMRIFLGYVFGGLLLTVGIKLRDKYLNYSAVMVSGAMSILYFITFFSYSFYDILSHTVAFLLMVLFTIFTVFSSLLFNKQVIALFGMVGAMAVPFLLNTGSGRIDIFFSYITIINLGIFFLAIKKYWKKLLISAFSITWIIYLFWFAMDYNDQIHFNIALLFTSIFFTLFYLSIIIYKLKKNQNFTVGDVVLLLVNSFLFYGFGYAILSGYESAADKLGLFTLINAIAHGLVCFLFYSKKLADQSLYLLSAGLSLIFITLAIPVQLDGNWVTTLWVGEAAVLYLVSKRMHVLFYEKLALTTLILALFSLFHDWSTGYFAYDLEYPETRIYPVLNMNFLGSTLFLSGLIFMNTVNANYPVKEDTKHIDLRFILSNFVVPGLLILVSYLAFSIEISNFWEQNFIDSKLEISSVNGADSNFYWNHELHKFKSVWLLIYTLAYVLLLSYLNVKVFRKIGLAYLILFFGTASLLAFLTEGLYVLSELTKHVANPDILKHYDLENSHFWLRYLSIFCAVFMLSTLKTTIQFLAETVRMKNLFEFLLHTSILVLCSSELIHWMDLFHFSSSDKLGLTILWGCYALFLIIYGIWKVNQAIRIGAIALLGITLIKLIFYDLIHLNTISKTVVFVSLGVLLLIVSFLYNKYKHKINS
jgi:uncharacterized membrane protein